MTARPRRGRAWPVVAGLLLILAATQALTMWLGARRPVEPATLLAGAAALGDPRAPTLGAADAPALGAADAVVVIHLFSDYACGNCRALHPVLRRLVAEDPGVRLVYRDWAVLGPRSVRAARLAVASTAQGRHAAFDDALMRRGGSLDEAALRAAADAAGLDWCRLQADAGADPAIARLLGDTDRLARGLGLPGTPTLVVGPYLVSGRVAPARLRALVAAARRAAPG